MIKNILSVFTIVFFMTQNANAEKLSYEALEAKVCDSSKQACKNLKKLYTKAKGTKVGGRLDGSTDEWELKAYTNKGSLTANIHLLAYHKERKVKYEAMMTYKRKNKYSSWNLVD